MQHVGDFPGKVDGIADAGVHALATHWTVDVRRVAKQKGTLLAELVGDSVVDVVCREPMHAFDIDAHPLNHVLTHIVPCQVVALVLGVRAHRANETRTPIILERKDEEKVGAVQCAVQFAIHDRAARVDIRDVKEMVVRAPWETNPQSLAHGGVGAVAPGEVGGYARSDRRRQRV